MADGDERLAEKINHKLQSDERLGVYALKARVYQEGVVHIQGIVDVLEEKNQAEELVKNIPEVRRIENDITVCTDGPVNDEDVAFEVSEELRANHDIPDSVGVKVVGGEAQLVGNVSNRFEENEAIETAAKARGVRDINSLLKYNESIDDVSLSNKVQSALVDGLEIAPGKVQVSSEDGIILLSGNVAKETEIRAVNIATGIPGVRKVVNDLRQDGNDNLEVPIKS